jgi:hypothetical protein
LSARTWSSFPAITTGTTSAITTSRICSASGRAA